jgi:hypothetical protein
MFQVKRGMAGKDMQLFAEERRMHKMQQVSYFDVVFAKRASLRSETLVPPYRRLARSIKLPLNSYEYHATFIGPEASDDASPI